MILNKISLIWLLAISSARIYNTCKEHILWHYKNFFRTNFLHIGLENFDIKLVIFMLFIHVTYIVPRSRVIFGPPKWFPFFMFNNSTL